MKVFELAKQFDVKSSVLVELLKDTSEKKITATTLLSEEQIDFVKSEMETIHKEKEEEERKEAEKLAAEKLEAERKEKETKRARTDMDFKPDEMIPCHSVFPGTLHFTGKHTGMTYTFFGAGDRRNVEYQDLKAAMLENAESIFKPDLVIDCDDLINDEHWMDVKAVYESMFSEKDVKKVLNLPIRQFKEAFNALPVTARKIIITEIATQIENGTFEQYNKAKAIDDICGTRFDLKM